MKELKSLLLEIPKGQVSTYASIAARLGINPRYAGRLLHENDDPNRFPCYKIVMSDGRIGGYGLGVKEKIARLKKDRIEIKDGKIFNFNAHFYNFDK